MKKYLLSMLTLFFAFYSFTTFAKAPKIISQSTQLLLVTAEDWATLQGKLQRYQRSAGGSSWTPIGPPIAVVIGKNGLGWGLSTSEAGVDFPNTEAEDGVDIPLKKEGDGKSPAGLFKIGTAFGINDKPAKLKLSYLPVKATTFCVDDEDSQYYNQIIDTSTVIQDWKNGTGEQMATVIPQYNRGAVVQYNMNPTQKGLGSCIFMHIWKNSDSGTAGCVAMDEASIKQVLTWLDPAKKPIIVLLPQNIYKTFQKNWGLPKLTS